MKFQTQKPSLPLSPFLETLWSLEIDCNEGHEESQLVVPNGMTQLIFHYGVPFFKKEGDRSSSQRELIICGPDKVSSQVTAPPGSGMVGVVFKPYGLQPFLKMPIAEITSIQVALGDLLGFDAEAFQEKLTACGDFNSRAATIEEFLYKKLFITCRYSWAMARESALRIRKEPHNLSLTQLSSDLNISQRSLERLFLSYVGVTPVFYLRICRFQNTLSLLKNQKNADLAEMALQCGYYDQSHLCNEIKRFCGLSPKALQAI